MRVDLTEAQREAQAGFVDFARREVLPLAEEIDRTEQIPRALIEKLAKAGYLASGLPPQLGGRHEDPIVHGLLHEAVGAASASVQGLLNVHHMAGSTIARWGSREQQERWLPGLASGELLGAFAMTEPAAGSDARVETRAEPEGDGYVLSGVKRWITRGASADLLVLLARVGGELTAFLLPARTEGLVREPIHGLLGCRGYEVSELRLEGCRVPREYLLARPGAGLAHVMAVGLDSGRYNLAWSCVGMAQACLDASLDRAEKRQQFGAPLKSFQLVQRQLTRMIVGIQGARLLCWRAGHARAERLLSASYEAMIAKYQASTMLNEVVHHAVQLHGAEGCLQSNLVQRCFRDARIMEIVEGSSQMLEMMIAKAAFGHVRAAAEGSP